MTATTPLPQIVAHMDQDRMRRYREHLDFVAGRQWQGYPRPRERRLTFNYARAIIDKTTSYLMYGMHTAVDPDTNTPHARARAARAETALRRVWEQNDLNSLDFDTEVDCATLGDAAYKVSWDPAASQIRVTAPDPQGLYAWHRADDLTTIWRVAQRWTAPADELAATLGRHVPSSRADNRVDVLEAWTADELTIWVDGQPHTTQPNPYGTIPYVLIPNLRHAGSPWGVSDLAPLIEPQRELNRALSQLSAILELSGNPIAVLENVDNATDIAVTPGAVWQLPADARAYLLDLLNGGGIRLHIDYIDLVYRTLHDLGESPRTAFGENRGGLSGVALNTELDPLLKKVHRKRLLRAAAYRRRNELILRLLEQYTGETYAPYRTRIVWGAVLPQDRSRQVQDAQMLVASGIQSRRRAADDLGIEDPDAEFARWLWEVDQHAAIGPDYTQLIQTQPAPSPPAPTTGSTP